MATQSLRLNAEELRSLGFASISSSYAAVGTGLSNPSPLYAIQNQTDSDLTWSWDGSTDMGFLAANGGHLILDISTNKNKDQTGLYVPKDRVLYVAVVSGGSNPTLGSVYVTAFYSETV